ncbi:MAG: formate dehydrogenase accessory sulfurtransferase FdhD [Bacteroidetes bacterium]|nr:formate dehydrogenase accessory sulfurtransferase FdhD [Fibrella sp.]
MVAPITIYKVDGDKAIEQPDLLAVEEPLEIRLGFGPHDAAMGSERQQRTVVVTMRTPGYDEELALGYLFTEGIIHDPGEIVSARHCVRDAEKKGNILRVELRPDVDIDWQHLERTSYASASCGVCGKASIDAVRANCPRPLSADLAIDPLLIHTLSDRLRAVQRTFAYTGGLHAAALFDAHGELQYVREDIGRHNALDKIIGAAFWNGQTPLSQHGVFLSGRIGFELVQKAWMAGVSVVAAVGAPSSLAVELAQEAGMTLIGFVRNNRFNIYTHPDRIPFSVSGVKSVVQA